MVTGWLIRKGRFFENKEKAFGNVEHQRSGLDWNLDNWIYVTIDPVRFKYTNGQLKVDSLVSGSNGQWGLTHDNHGRLFFSRAASGIAASGFQINPAYGQLDFEMRHLRILARLGPLSKRLMLTVARKRCAQTARCKSLLPSRASQCFGATDFPKAWRATI
jgi:hypothetical protein